MTLAERFVSKYRVTDGGCWEWTAMLSSNGYGRISFNRSPKYAHRVSYELHVGPIPDGMHIDHLCKNRRCVNPAHLEPVTQAVNNQRAQRDTCIRGHKFDAVVRRRGRPAGRRCIACHRRHNARSKPGGDVRLSGDRGES